MKLISENLHIISKEIKEAILNKNEAFISNLLTRQIATNPDWIDLNIGPAKKGDTMAWLVNIYKSLNSNIPLSFDTSNKDEIIAGLKLISNPDKCIINSTSADEEKLEAFTAIASEYNTNLVALTLNKEIGIPKTADGRLELAFNIIEKTSEKGIDNSRIFFDPLILPIGVEQTQANQALDAIRMFKESFDPQTQTTIGLSNVSNGSPKELRPLINQTFFILAAGCGLDSAIVDSFDSELLRINKVIETREEEKPQDKLILGLFDTMQNFGELEETADLKNCAEAIQIYKTAEILLNKKIYSHSYLEIN